MATLSAVDLLKEEFCRRRDKNPRYSMRAFAASLRIPSGRLSEIFSGKRNLSAKLSKKILLQMAASTESHRRFSEAIAGVPQTSDYLLLEEDRFSVIADWYHFAILSLIETKNFSPNSHWIAKRLGISAVQSEMALERLLRLGLLERDSQSRLRLAQAHTTTTSDIPSGALKASHRQTLEQAIECLETVDVEEREISSITMAIDVHKLPEAKKLVKDFRRRLAKLLEQGQRTEVYNLNIQLVPVTKRP